MAECRGFKNKLGTTIVSLIAKVTGAVAGNIAIFNNNGELIDSGRTVDTQVTSGSSNLITSGAAYLELNEKASREGDGENFSVNKIVFSEGDAHASIEKTDKTITVGDDDYYEVKGFDFNINGDTIQKTISVDVEDLEALSSHDTTVTKNSSKLITSGAVYEKTSDFNIKLVTSSGRIRLLFNTNIDARGPVVYPLRKFVVINYVTGISSETLTEETYLGLFSYEEDPSDSDAPITIYIQIGGACISFSGSFIQRTDGGAVFIPAGDTPQEYYNNYKVIGSGTQNSYPSNS